MKRVLFSVKTSRYSNTDIEFASDEMSDADADLIMAAMARTKLVQPQGLPGKYTETVLVVDQSQGFRATVVEDIAIVTAAQYAKLEAEHKTLEAARAQKNAEKAALAESAA